MGLPGGAMLCPGERSSPAKPWNAWVVNVLAMQSRELPDMPEE